jgi:hypothetical protein
MAISLWSRLPPPNSVGSDELKDGAVTTNKIADGAVTSPKAGDSLKSEHILGDDTEVTTTSTTYAEVKNFNFYKDTTVESINWKTMEVVAEGRVSASGPTNSIGIFVDAESNPQGGVGDHKGQGREGEGSTGAQSGKGLKLRCKRCGKLVDFLIGDGEVCFDCWDRERGKKG